MTTCRGFVRSVGKVHSLRFGAAYTPLVEHSSPILPPATIGILGGGQLGRMLALAARAMGYRVWVLDPDPACPAAPVIERLVLGAYDDVDAALELAAGSEVVTYELEHVDAAMVEAVARNRPVRPGLLPLRVTQDRLAERRFLASRGVGVAPWREVRSTEDLRGAATALGLPLRVKVPIGGYDGRSQVRVTSDPEIEAVWTRLSRPAGEPLLAERELDFEAELSVIVARDTDGRVVPFPVSRNVHDTGILVESVAPAPLARSITDRAVEIGTRLAEGMDLCGTLTVELFLLRDGSVAVNELAPRVHNSGHWTLEGAATSQFEQHIRAICGLGLGSPAPIGSAAMVNLLGTGPKRAARLLGVDDALADPSAHLHLYDKRLVFERRKMGHLTVVDASSETALERARRAAAALRWADDDWFEAQTVASAPAGRSTVD
jgi:5-(carboxyamino)imidazole ribonucleotide synthase